MESDYSTEMPSSSFRLLKHLPLILLSILLIAFPSKANVYEEYYEMLDDYFKQLQEFYLIIKNHYESGEDNTWQGDEQHPVQQPVHQVTESNRIFNTQGQATTKMTNTNVDSGVSGISDQKKQLLEMHNAYRRRVANGEVEGQPASSKIRDLVCP